MTRFRDLLKPDLSTPKEEQDRAAKGLVDAVEQSNLRRWAGRGRLPAEGKSLLLAVAPYSRYDLALLDVIDESLDAMRPARVPVYVVNLLEYEKAEQVAEDFPGAASVHQTPLAVIWESGSARKAASGKHARDMAADVLGLSADDLSRRVRAASSTSTSAGQTRYLFPDALSDRQQYEGAEAMWRRAWETLIDRLGESALWQTPWMGTPLGDGTPMLDANPIFSAVSTELRQGVRVIQMKPAGRAREISFLIDKFGEGESGKIDELVIACVLTDETLLYAIDAMEQWIAVRQVHILKEHDRLVFPRLRNVPRRIHIVPMAA